MRGISSLLASAARVANSALEDVGTCTSPSHLASTRLGGKIMLLDIYSRRT